jgi:hypothetical protein
MVETWEHLLNVPMVDPVRRILMEALEVETSIAEGEQALQALLKFASAISGKVFGHGVYESAGKHHASFDRSGRTRGRCSPEASGLPRP